MRPGTRIAPLWGISQRQSLRLMSCMVEAESTRRTEKRSKSCCSFHFCVGDDRSQPAQIVARSANYNLRFETHRRRQRGRNQAGLFAFFHYPHRPVSLIARREPQCRTKNNCAETGDTLFSVDDTLARKLQRRVCQLGIARDRLKRE